MHGSSRPTYGDYEAGDLSDIDRHLGDGKGERAVRHIRSLAHGQRCDPWPLPPTAGFEPVKC
jgi:hypothetical protein